MNIISLYKINNIVYLYNNIFLYMSLCTDDLDGKPLLFKSGLYNRYTYPYMLLKYNAIFEIMCRRLIGLYAVGSHCLAILYTYWTALKYACRPSAMVFRHERSCYNGSKCYRRSIIKNVAQTRSKTNSVVYVQTRLIFM